MKIIFTLISAYSIVFVLFTQSTSAQYSNESIEQFASKADSDCIEETINFLKGDVTDFYPGEILTVIKKSFPGKSSDETIYVLPYIKDNLIFKGDEYQRVQDISSNLLNYLGLIRQLNLIYYRSEIPITGFISPNTLFISSAAESILSDSEIEALLAHEVSHLIIHQQFKKYAENNNYKEMRLLELFADSVAITIIDAKKGRGKSESLINGLKKMQARVTLVTNKNEEGMKHPTLKSRKKLFDKLQQNFDRAFAKAVK